MGEVLGVWPTIIGIDREAVTPPGPNAWTQISAVPPIVLDGSNVASFSSALGYSIPMEFVVLIPH